MDSSGCQFGLKFTNVESMWLLITCEFLWSHKSWWCSHLMQIILILTISLMFAETTWSSSQGLIQRDISSPEVRMALMLRQIIINLNVHFSFFQFRASTTTWITGQLSSHSIVFICIVHSLFIFFFQPKVLWVLRKKYWQSTAPPSKQGT